MIKANYGHVKIEGEETEVLADLSSIIKAFKNMLTESHGEETAREIIAHAGRLAFMTDEQLDAEVENKWRREHRNDNS